MGCLKLDKFSNLEKVHDSMECSLKVLKTVASNDYYPYGKILRKYVPGNGDERYLTTGHERDHETISENNDGTGLDNRGARFYDSDVARFLSLDPHATDYKAWSAYHYVLGNPITFIDPDGKNAWKPDGNGGWIAEAGDGAETLARDAGISRERAYDVMEKQGFGTYTENGVTKSAVDRGDIVRLGPSRQTGVTVNCGDGCATSTAPRYTFEAGKTYPISSRYFEPVSYAIGSVSELELNYNNESIISSGFALGAELQVGAFSGLHQESVTFNQTMSGESLLEVFNQTKAINSFTFGSFLNYTSITGLNSKSEKMWNISGAGGGFSAGFGGSRSTPNFENK